MSNILFDYDSVIADTQQLRITETNKRFGTNYDKSSFKSWKDDTLFPAEHLAFMWGPECFMNCELQLLVDALPGAIETINALYELGHKGIVVSDRPIALYETTREWLDVEGLSHVPLIFTKSPAMTNIAGDATQSKAQIAYLHKLRIIIEDSPHHAESLATKDFVDQIFLLDMPYNQMVSHEKITRVPNWETINQILCQTT